MKLLVLLVFLFAQSIFSSMHISSCPDEAFLKLGAAFPSVGRIMHNINGFIGSGTLIDTGNPELCGRVILTCCHNLEDLSETDAFFSLNGEDRSFIRFIPHPKFEKFLELMAFNAYDIAICLLISPLSTEGVEMDLDLSLKDAVDRVFTVVGFGLSGHFAGNFAITDNKRRASHSFSSRFCHEAQQKVIQEQYAHTKLSDKDDIESYMYGALVLSTNGNEKVTPLPHGTTGSGDSGGPVFSISGKLTAIVNISSSTSVSMSLITQSALTENGSRYEKFYREEILEHQRKMQAKFPEKQEYLVVPFIKDDCVDRYSAPRTPAEQAEIIDFFARKYGDPPLEKEAIAARSIDPVYILNHTQENVLVSIHKKWILNVLSEIIAKKL